MIRTKTLFTAVTTALALAMVAGHLPQAAGQEPVPPYRLLRVEEDWVGLIRTPDDATSAPQIVNVISPRSTLDGVFGMVEVNHSSFPTFNDGGFQVQGWAGNTLAASGGSSVNSALVSQYDRLEYTVVMTRETNGISFHVENGRSRTWGEFGGPETRCTVLTEWPTLRYYSPEVSVEHTNVNLGAHRVEVLYLRETRCHYGDGSVVTDGTMRVIHRFRDLVQEVSLAEYDQNPQYYNINITE